MAQHCFTLLYVFLSAVKERKFCDKHKIPLNKIVYIATDGGKCLMLLEITVRICERPVNNMETVIIYFVHSNLFL